MSEFSFKEASEWPQALRDAISSDWYGYVKGGNEFSATELLKPPRMVALQRKYMIHDRNVMGDGTVIFRLLGQALHKTLEEVGGIVERRFYASVGDTILSGQVDLIEFDTIYDYKVCSVAAVKGDVKEDWVQQLNVLKYLVERSDDNYVIKHLRIVAILRDWIGARKDTPGYPNHPVQIIDIPVWEASDTARFIEVRVRQLTEAMAFLPECDDTERWAKEDTWAIMKKGNRRASKISKQEPDEAELDPESKIEHRPGDKWVRCGYCPVSSVCEQFLLREIL